MGSPRWRPAAPALAAVLGALLAACGPGAQTTHRPSHHPKAVTLSGSLLRVRATTLILQVGAGLATVRVTFRPTATPIYAVTNSTASAIEPGSCVALRGKRDTTGMVSAGVMVVTSSVDDTCPPGVEPLPPPPADPSRSPSPPSPRKSPSPSPSPGPGPVVLTGQVLGMGGGAVAVEVQQGDPHVVLVPRDAQVFLYQPSGPAALVVPSCVVVQGTRAGHAIAARKIVDWPAGTQC